MPSLWDPHRNYRERSLAICLEGVFTAPSAGTPSTKPRSSVSNELLWPVPLHWEVWASKLWSPTLLEQSLPHCKVFLAQVSSVKERGQAASLTGIGLLGVRFMDTLQLHIDLEVGSNFPDRSLVSSWISPTGHSPADPKTFLCSFQKKQMMSQGQNIARDSFPCPN